MSFYIKKIKISNFLSFFGEHEAELKRFTGIICDFDQGRDDFLKALEFVFRMDSEDQNINHINGLINPNIKQNGSEVSEIDCYVEVSLQFVGRDKNDQTIRKRVDNQHVQYRIGNEVVSKFRYREKLDELGLNMENKNLIFYKNYFYDVINGSSEDLEKVVVKCLRAPYLAEELKKARNDVKRLQEAKEIHETRKYLQYKRDHNIIAKFADKFEGVQSRCESLRQQLLTSIRRTVEENSQEISDSELDIPILTTGSQELNRLEAEREREMNEILELENEKEIITKEYEELKSEEISSLWELYYCEIELAKKSGKPNLLTYRIKQLKKLMNEEKDKLAIICSEIKENELELVTIAENIRKNFALISEIRRTEELQNCLSEYGRLADRICPSENLKLLRNILGDDLFYGTLVENLEEAKKCVEDLAMEAHNECMETFIDLSCHPKLKDTILTKEENGVDISDSEKLLIFLFKLKNYGLISKVPILARQTFNYEIPEEIENDKIFTTDGIMLTTDGLITRLNEYDEDDLENEEEVLNRLNGLIMNQEMKTNEIFDLHHQKEKSKIVMQRLEDSISLLRTALKKFPQSTRKTIFYGSAFIRRPAIYEEYKDFFTEQDQLFKEAEQNAAKEFEELFPARSETLDIDGLQADHDQMLENIQNLQSQLEEREEEILSIEIEIRKLYAGFLCLKRIPMLRVRKTRNLKSQSIMFYEKLMKSLKELMKEKDVYEFQSTKDLRMSTVKILESDFKDIQKELEEKEIALDELSIARTNKLKPLTDHCSRYFFQTFRFMLHSAINFLELVMDNSKNKLQILTSLRKETINLVDFDILNTFLKFISILCLFLQISVFENTPVLVLDDVSHLFPDDDSVMCILSENIVNQIIPESENLSFDLIGRIGEYLEFFIRRNTTRPPIRRVPPQQINGPAQLILFADSDFASIPENQVLISQKIVPEGSITLKYPYFSSIQTINF